MLLIILLTFLWLLHPISILSALYMRFRKRIPVLHTNKQFSKNWQWIQKAGWISSGILLFYIVFIVLIKGWTFRWYMGGLLVQVLLLLIIDRHLIAVNYSKRFWTGASSKTRNAIRITRMISYGYIALRLTFLLYWFIGTGIMLLFPAGFTTDVYVLGIYSEITGEKHTPRTHSPFGTIINATESRYTTGTYFNGDAIIYKQENSDELYLFRTKYWIFMKNANPDFMIFANGDPEQLEFDAGSNTLYLDLKNDNNKLPAERNKIVSEQGHYYLDQYFKQVNPGQNNTYEDTAWITVQHKRIKL